MEDDDDHGSHDDIVGLSPSEHAKKFGRIRKTTAKVRGLLSSKKKKRKANREKKQHQKEQKEPLLSMSSSEEGMNLTTSPSRDGDPRGSPVMSEEEESHPFDVERNVEWEFEEARASPTSQVDEFMVPELEHEEMPSAVLDFYESNKREIESPQSTQPFDETEPKTVGATIRMESSHETDLSLFELEGSRELEKDDDSSSYSSAEVNNDDDDPDDPFDTLVGQITSSILSDEASDEDGMETGEAPNGNDEKENEDENEQEKGNDVADSNEGGIPTTDQGHGAATTGRDETESREINSTADVGEELPTSAILVKGKEFPSQSEDGMDEWSDQADDSTYMNKREYATTVQDGVESGEEKNADQDKGVPRSPLVVEKNDAPTGDEEESEMEQKESTASDDVREERSPSPGRENVMDGSKGTENGECINNGEERTASPMLVDETDTPTELDAGDKTEPIEHEDDDHEKRPQSPGQESEVNDEEDAATEQDAIEANEVNNDAAPKSPVVVEENDTPTGNDEKDMVEAKDEERERRPSTPILADQEVDDFADTEGNIEDPMESREGTCSDDIGVHGRLPMAPNLAVGEEVDDTTTTNNLETPGSVQQHDDDTTTNVSKDGDDTIQRSDKTQIPESSSREVAEVDVVAHTDSGNKLENNTTRLNSDSTSSKCDDPTDRDDETDPTERLDRDAIEGGSDAEAHAGNLVKTESTILDPTAPQREDSIDPAVSVDREIAQDSAANDDHRKVGIAPSTEAVEQLAPVPQSVESNDLSRLALISPSLAESFTSSWEDDGHGGTPTRPNRKNANQISKEPVCDGAEQTSSKDPFETKLDDDDPVSLSKRDTDHTETKNPFADSDLPERQRPPVHKEPPPNFSPINTEKEIISRTMCTTSSDDNSSKSSSTVHNEDHQTLLAAPEEILGTSDDTSTSSDEGIKFPAGNIPKASAVTPDREVSTPPPIEEGVKYRNHEKLKAFESRRQSSFSDIFESTSLKWKSSIDIMRAGLCETARAHRLVLGSVLANQAYGEAMQLIYEDVYLDDEGNTVGNSMVGAWRQNRLSQQRSTKDYTLVLVKDEGAWRDSVHTPEERRGGMLTSLIDVQSVLAQQFEESAKHSVSSIKSSELTSYHQELEAKVLEFEKRGKSIISELKLAESRVKEAWDAYVKVFGGALIIPSPVTRTPERQKESTSPKSPSSARSTGSTGFSSFSKLSPKRPPEYTRDLWLAEMRYRIAVTYQAELWEKASPEVMQLVVAVTEKEAERQTKMQEMLLDFLPRQRRLLSGFTSVHSPVLHDLLERHMDQEVEEDIHETIQSHSKTVQMKEAQHKSAILNRSRRNLVEPEVTDLEKLESPLISNLIFSIKVVERKVKSSGDLVWKKALAVVTVDSYLHLFDIPQSSKHVSTPDEAFAELKPTPIEDVYEWPEEASKEMLKDVIPSASLLLPKCSITTSKDNAREFEVAESRVGMFQLALETVLSLRTESETETKTWVDTKLEPKMWKKSNLESQGEKQYVVV